jgi:ubiquinone/menaquinone biosynthesis C-methylase UbiE
MGATGTAAVTPQRVMQFAWGYAAPLLMEAAVRHGVFDLLDEGPKTVAEVAAASGASERGLRATMNALVGLQLLTKDSEGRYGLAGDSAAFLVSGKPGYLGGILRHLNGQLIPNWLRLSDVVGTGKPVEAVNREGTGAEFFHEFVAAIFPMSYPSAQRLAEALDVDNSQKPVKVLDLAAGSGVWGIALAQKSPKVSVTALDWPGVLDVTRGMANRFGLTKQFEFRAGGLLEADFGRGYNIATLGHILHSEGERSSRALLKKTFDAMAPGGTIAIAEFLVDEERRDSAMGLIFAVNMLVHTDEGDTYSFPEIASWLREAGFRDARTLEAPGPSPLILATRP